MKLSAILELLVDSGADTTALVNAAKKWESDQADALQRRREADAARQAAKRLRDAESRDSRDVTVTVSSRGGDARVEDNLLPKKISGQEDKAFASPSARPKNGTRLPDDFEPDTEWAQAHGLSPAEASHEAAQFLDYWRAKAGKDGVKLDWLGTWRMWVRNAIKNRRSAPAPRATAPPTPKKTTLASMWRDEARNAGILPDERTDQNHGRMGASHTAGPDSLPGIARRIAGAGG